MDGVPERVVFVEVRLDTERGEAPRDAGARASFVAGVDAVCLAQEFLDRDYGPWVVIVVVVVRRFSDAVCDGGGAARAFHRADPPAAGPRHPGVGVLRLPERALLAGLSLSQLR